MLAVACRKAVEPWKMTKINPCYRTPKEPENNEKTGQSMPAEKQEAVLLQCSKYLDAVVSDS